MSLVQQAIKAAIQAGSPSIIRDIRGEMVLEDEQPLWAFINHHLATYGQLPTVETISAAGFSLASRVLESPAFYVDKIRDRYAYNLLNQRHPHFAEAMREQRVNDALSILREMIQSVGSTLNPNTFTTLASELTRVVADFEFAKIHPGLRGIPLGWETLDAATLGAQGGDLIVIVGRPSMGKSYLLLKAAHAAWSSGHSVAFISMEMSLIQIARRWLSLTTGINPRFIQQGMLSTFMETAMRNVVSHIQENASPVHLLAGDMNKNVEGVEQLCESTNPDLICVDAAYLLSPGVRASGGYISKWEQISLVISQLKQLAIRLNRPIVITVQFNRNVKSSSTRELDMGDIGGSDSIPQDASVIVGARKGPAPHQDTQRICEIMKNREGETGRFATNFQFEPVDFSEVPLQEEEEEEQHEVDMQWMS